MFIMYTSPPSKCFPVFYTLIYIHLSWESSFVSANWRRGQNPDLPFASSSFFLIKSNSHFFPTSINRSINHRWKFRRIANYRGIQIRVESIFKLKFNWFLLFDWVWFFRCCQWPMTECPQPYEIQRKRDRNGRLNTQSINRQGNEAITSKAEWTYAMHTHTYIEIHTTRCSLCKNRTNRVSEKEKSLTRRIYSTLRRIFGWLRD